MAAQLQHKHVMIVVVRSQALEPCSKGRPDMTDPVDGSPLMNCSAWPSKHFRATQVDMFEPALSISTIQGIYRIYLYHIKGYTCIYGMHLCMVYRYFGMCDI